MNTSQGKIRSRILENLSPELLQLLYYHALSMEIDDNNIKAAVIKDLLSDYGFRELGPGTNRTCYQKNGYVFKFALDRRGLVDNFSEFKRSPEIPMYTTKTYETNFVVAISEYANLMDAETFSVNADLIRQVLHELSKHYIFGDIGINPSNFENWGWRDNGDIVCIDYAYMFPIAGNEQVLVCPLCKHGDLDYDQNYVKFICNDCHTKFRYIDIRRRMNQDLENTENMAISSLYDLQPPNLDKLNEEIGPIMNSYRRLINRHKDD